MSGCQSTGDGACAPAPLDTVESALTTGDIERLRSVPADNREREALARSYLEAHCPAAIAWHIPRSHRQSYSCLIKGVSADRIVIGAHYDRTGRGQGVVDNWTGVVFLSKLLTWFENDAPNVTLEFVMFGEEEPGMLGSSAFLRQHQNAGQIRAMINLDTFGIGPVTIDRRSDNELECLALNVGRTLEVETERSYLRESTGDWAPFDEQNIPVLNVNSLDRRGLRLIHTSRDRFDAVDIERLEQAWRIVLNLAINLDRRGLD